MPSFDSPAQAAQAASTYVKNADDALSQKIIREEQLYVWENQLQAIDEYLADTEDLTDEDGLADARAEAREAKGRLEAAIAGFFEEPIEDEDPATNAIALLEVGAGLIEEVEAVLAQEFKTVDAATPLEDALVGVKQWLSDTELLSGNEVMAQARKEMKSVKVQMDQRMTELIKAFNESDSG